MAAVAINNLDMALGTQKTQDASEFSKVLPNEHVLAPHIEEREKEPIDMVFHGIADVYGIPPAAALELLCLNMESLGKSTAEVSADSLPAAPSHPHGMRCKDEISNREEAIPIRIAESHAPAANGTIARDLLQLNVLSKRFVSKKEPPISLRDYLLRLHRYCPMSTAVYLATSAYFTRMAVIEQFLSVNIKNMHRLVLAGLRVAMKALEDLSYPHSRVAKVGGVSERELSKIEISFCFLVDFKLRVDAQMLLDEAKALIRRNIGSEGDSGNLVAALMAPS